MAHGAQPCGRRDGAIEVTAAENCAEHIEHLFRLHGARWESRGQSGVLANDHVRAFHRVAAPALLEAGLLHSAVLRVAGDVAGIYHGMRRGTEEFAYLSGFDPAFAFEAPGTLLFCWSIEDSIAAGVDALPFPARARGRTSTIGVRRTGGTAASP